MASMTDTPIIDEEDSQKGSFVDISNLPPLENLRWVLFDLDMTLWNHDAAIRHSLAVICDELNHDFDPFMMHYNEQSRALWLEFSRGELDIADLRLLRLGNVFRLLGNERSTEEIERISEQSLEIYLDYQGEMPGSYEVMRHAVNQAKLGVLTNATRLTQNTKIRQLEGSDLLSMVLTVDETGCAKADPKFYQHAMKEMGNPAPESVLYVGDSWHDDVKPALRVGWNIAWIDVHRKGPAEHQNISIIHNVGDLVGYFSK